MHRPERCVDKLAKMGRRERHRGTHPEHGGRSKSARASRDRLSTNLVTARLGFGSFATRTKALFSAEFAFIDGGIKNAPSGRFRANDLSLAALGFATRFGARGGEFAVQSRVIAAVALAALATLGAGASPASAAFILPSSSEATFASAWIGEARDSESPRTPGEKRAAEDEVPGHLEFAVMHPCRTSSPPTEPTGSIGAATMPESLEAPCRPLLFVWMAASGDVQLPQAVLAGVFRPPRRQPSKSSAAIAAAPLSQG